MPYEVAEKTTQPLARRQTRLSSVITLSPRIYPLLTRSTEPYFGLDDRINHER
jgi:hypothetical protein